MGKGIVRLLNLGYLAACAVSIWAVCTKPIVTTSVNLDMTPEKLGEVLQPLFANATGSGSSESRAFVTREAKTEKEITDYITVDRIADAFRSDDPEKNGLHLSIPVTIAAKYAFDLKNYNVINEIVVANIETVLDRACTTLSTPLTNFIFSITKEFAIDALEASINEQIKNAIGEDSPISATEVEEIYNNVYEALSTNEGSIPLSDLTDVIINGKDGEGTSALSILNKFTRYVYQECDPALTEEVWAANPTEYFIHDDEADKYVNTETFKDGVTYFTYIYEACDPAPTQEEYAAEPAKYFVFDSDANKYVNTETYNSEASYFVRKDNPYTQEDLDRVDIEGQMEDALKSVPGLVDNEYVEATDVSEAQFLATLKSTKYYLSKDGLYTQASFGENYQELYIKNGDNYEYVGINPEDFDSTLQSTVYWILDGEEYKIATTYSADTKYYTSVATIKDIDSALVALINEYLLKKGGSSEGGDESSAYLRSSRAEALTNAKSKEELNAALKEFAYKYIPLDKISSVNDRAGKYVPLALLGIVVLVAFPWALFALVTFIRTLRRDKVWTKPWIIFVLAFPQVIFGFVITYGLKYGLPLVGRLVEIVQKVLDTGVSAEITTLCLIPSFVYLGVLVYTIIYACFAHDPKAQYKFEKRAMTMYRKRPRVRRYY